MKEFITKMKGKKVLSLLLAAIMVLSVASPAFSEVLGVIANAASAYPVELGFNNIFIFEEWASNENSTTVVYGGEQNVGSLTSDVSAGSFKIEKSSTAVPQVYNGHGMDKTDSMNNTDYYSMDVEPNTAYCFSYNLNSFTGDSASVAPYLFMFDSDFLCRVIYAAPVAVSGSNSFVFTTPSDVEHFQFRFTLSANGVGEADISNISVTKCDYALDLTNNLFNYNSWKEASSKTPNIYNDGTVTPNTDGSIDIETNTDASNLGGSLFTGFELGYNASFYNIAVEPNTKYLLNYNLINSANYDFIDFVPYIVRNGSDNSVDYVEGCGASGYGKGSCMFATSDTTTSIQVVFTSTHGNQTWKFRLQDIELFKVTELDDNKITPNRLLKNYGSDATYDTLPTITVPEKYVFAGWNTKEDGSGMRIAAETPVQPVSYTVYPVIQPAVDTLAVATQPTKQVYTKGEKLDTTGLVLSATQKYTDEDGDAHTSTFNINSGYYCTPEILDTVGTQTITVSYGGKTATFTVTVKENDPGNVIVNGASWDVTIANKEYTFNYNSASAFNRYEVTYSSDSYVSGVATFNDGKTEEFFLEPSDNGNFSSYIDGFLEDKTYTGIVKIKFTTLDKENGNFELISLNTTKVADPGNTVYFQNSKYKMGISLEYGGVVSELYDNSNGVYARTYKDADGNDITQIDYKTKLEQNYGNLTQTGESQEVNLINTYDRGRYLQQSYYGTGDKPYVESEYNNAAWPYNPVQGGNVIGEASKIIDYKITDDYVYIKARPLDWAKWSDEYAETDSRYTAEWGDSYITDTYVEAWYYFQEDTIKVINRKVDYSGLPEASHSQEFPALYLAEPLNHFVYNNVSKEDAWGTLAFDETNYQFIPYEDAKTHWTKKPDGVNGKLINYEEPEYWGLSELYKDEVGMEGFEPWVNVNENWAAFTASEDSDSFGVGIYTDATNKFYYGVQPTIFAQEAGSTEGSVGSVDPNTELYRHATTTNPATELATSYIAPTDTMIFKSYEPTEYTYYLTTGKVTEIRDTFEEIYNDDAEKERNKTKIAVPETVYLEPEADGEYQYGQYYVNNILNENNYYQIETKTESNDMYLGVYAKGAKTVTVDVTNITNPDEDVDVYNLEHTASYDGQPFATTIDDANEDTFIFAAGLDMDFVSGGLAPGEKAKVKWEITVTKEDGTTETYTAYTVMYAPQRTVGAVAESRKIEASSNEISSWITGANGVDHSTWSPLGSLYGDKKGAGYFTKDPLVYPNAYVTDGTGESADDYIEEQIMGADVDNNVYNENTYVMQTATNGNDSSRAKSYLGLLTVDGSRYTNTNQIPNLKIGYDVLRRGDKNDNISIGALGTYNSLSSYSTYYTLGTAESFTSTSTSERPGADWTQYPTSVTIDTAVPSRESTIPEYKVSEIDGKYIHALNFAVCTQTYVSAVPEHRYATAGTSVLCSVTYKEALREAVTDAYSVKNPSEDFLEKVEDAAYILGDPSATQADIDLSQKELDEALSQIVDTLYALKYDNIFSAYEFSQNANSMTVVSNRGTATYADGTITVVNDTITGGEAYTSYGSGEGNYLVTLEPDTEYVFEYDVTTDVKAQAFMFFYNSSGGNGDVPTNMSIKVNNGSWSSKSESNPWWGNYTNSAGTYHYAIKFTTGATTTQAAFRFGNTSNDPVTSTFSNIKLVDSAHYYEDVEYTSVYDLYSEYSSYGVLPVLQRPGYTFGGWEDSSKKEVTGSDVAVNHKTIYSVWSETVYSIIYDANGGAGELGGEEVIGLKDFTLPSTGFSMDKHQLIGWAYTKNATTPVFDLGQTISIEDIEPEYINASNDVTLYAVWEKAYSVYFSPNGGKNDDADGITPSYKRYSEDHILPDSTGISNYGYKFLGWALNSSATTPDYYAGEAFNVSKIDKTYINETNQEVTLNAVWGKIGPQNVTFDNMVDITAWSQNVSDSTKGTVMDRTDTGFTVKSYANTGEATCSSSYFPVEAGHKYVVEADIKGSKWDVYVFFCKPDGNWTGFNDSASRFSSGNHNQTTNGIHVTSIEFTAPDDATQVQLRVDANADVVDNVVKFDNIRMYDTSKTTYVNPVNKVVAFGDAYGTLPTPVRDGAKFLGWVDKNGNTVTATDLMESDSTVYLTSTWSTDNNHVLNDTVVVDYGLPVKIELLSNDGDNAEAVNAIGTGVSTENLNTFGHDESKLTGTGTTINLKYGTATLAENIVTYTPSTTNFTAEEEFYYEVKIGDSYYYAKVTIIPATSIYYEDTLFTFNDSENDDGTKYEWQTLGTSVSEHFQSADRPGYNFRNDANDIYGYDSAYDSNVAYSGGTAHYVDVDKASIGFAPSAEFTFTGTGFDLFSVTDNKTGAIRIDVTNVSTGKVVERKLVNAYYGYNYENNKYVAVAPGDDNANYRALFQVPVLSLHDMDYGTYDVKVIPYYSTAFDINKVGSFGVYVDSVRIFDPMGTENDVANEAYAADGEYAPQYRELRETLVTSTVDTDGNLTFDVSKLGKDKSLFLDGGKSTADDFGKIGPNNEIYLAKDQAISFDIETDSTAIPETIQIGMKLTGYNGSDYNKVANSGGDYAHTGTVTLANTDYSGWTETVTLNSATERYYDMEAVLEWEIQTDGTFKTVCPVIITNTSDAVISITSIKWAFGQSDNATTQLNLLSDEQTVTYAKAAMARAASNDDQNNPQNTFLAKENIATAFSGEPYTVGDNGTLVITTEQGVAGVTVNGADVVNCEATEDSKLQWTYEFTADTAGNLVYEIVARDENGVSSETIYVSTNVEADESGDREETTTPEGDGEGDNESDSDSDSDSGVTLIPGDDLFAYNLVRMLFRFLNKILSMLTGGATV